MVSLREQTVLNPDQDDLSRVSLPRPVGHALRAGRPDLARPELARSMEGFAASGIGAHRALLAWEVDAVDRRTGSPAPAEVTAWAEREGVAEVAALRRALLWV